MSQETVTQIMLGVLTVVAALGGYLLRFATRKRNDELARDRHSFRRAAASLAAKGIGGEELRWRKRDLSNTQRTSFGPEPPTDRPTTASPEKDSDSDKPKNYRPSVGPPHGKTPKSDIAPTFSLREIRDISKLPAPALKKVTKGPIDPQQVQLVMRVLITFAVIGGCGYVVLSRQFEEATNMWATGLIGAVIGHWFGFKSE